MDFSLVMLLLLMLTGVTWGLDRWLGARIRQRAARALRERNSPEEAVAKVLKEPVIVEYARAFFPVILVVFVLRAFIVEPFRIPSGSMLPSLLAGDFILVNKFSYGIRFPVFNKKIISTGSPRRGDVIVFRYPADPSVNYIKRAIGLPGDHVVYKAKKLYINSKEMTQTAQSPYILREAGAHLTRMQHWTEDLDGVRHNILTTEATDASTTEFTVPPGYYFVMGDNRDRSNDSRYWGYVPEDNLIGKAFFIWFSWDLRASNNRFWDRVLWRRIGSSIQ